MGIGIKRSETGGSGSAAAKLIRDVGTLFSPFNKAKGGSTEIDELGAPEPVLTLKMDDEELLGLAKNWEEQYTKYSAKIVEKQKTNKKYWLGHHYGFDIGEHRQVDNVIFKSVETLLPIISRQNPDPYVLAQDVQIADDVAKAIEDISDREALKTKIKKGVRHWAIYYISATKISWSAKKDAIQYELVHPDDLILDPNGNFEGGEFLGRFIGHKKKQEAKDLAVMFSDKADLIKEFVGKNMGTMIPTIEWWTDEYVFWTMGDSIVLDKRQNPHWDYDSPVEQMDEFGESTTTSREGFNLFDTPKKPFSFLSVFNLGKHPHDETGLIEQAIPLQDMVNKTARQIDKNADDANSGWIFNSQFNEDAGKQALSSLRNGGAIIAPTININESVTRIQSPSLPEYVYRQKVDAATEIENIIGTRGSSASGIASERTVQGKIEIKQSDSDRVALIVEHVEQMVDYLYNYTAQMIFTYYDAQDLRDVLGEERGVALEQYMDEGQLNGLRISVKEGSLIPQDPLLRRNEAIELFQLGALDPVTMFERMNFSDPKEASRRLLLYKTDPGGLLKEGAGGGEQELPPEMVEGMPPDPNQPLI